MVKVNILTPWYPDAGLGHLYSGVFVHQQVKALQSNGVDVSIEVPKCHKHYEKVTLGGLFTEIEKLASLNPESIFRTNQGALIIPYLTTERASMAEQVSSIERALYMKRKVLPSDSDINHVHVALPIAPALSKVSSKPLVVTEHSSHVRKDCQIPEVAEMYRQTIEVASAFICVSYFLQKQISEMLNVDIGPKWKVVPNIVDFDSFPFVERSDNSCRSWIYVGALFESKGVMKLLKTFHHFKSNSDEKATLTLVGKGPLERWIRTYAKKHNIANAVCIREPQSQADITNFFYNADLMVHLSPFETFGLVSLEAIASGLPVVSLNNGGSKETWADLSELCGLHLREDLSFEEISSAISGWRDSHITLNLAEASRELEQRFSPDSIYSQLDQIYSSVLK
ncbi:MAG: glycosyltransferase family 4 protein [Acidimicrobiales bacterium]|nr:glycosyltransferase family 4 protein [Acidimicrobiales bacterium]HJM37740.1 glycosyltransferase family 4 protein [Acidimicrobiales bacterium]